MKLVELLEKLAKKSGVDLASEAYKSIQIPDLDIHDDVARSLDTKLLTEDSAYNNDKIRGKIRAEALNGIDALVNTILEENGLGESDAIKKATNSYERTKALFAVQKEGIEAKIKEAVQKAGKEGNGKEVYEKQIADLQELLKVSKQTLTDKETEFKSTRENDLTDFEIQKILLGKNYALPKEMDADLKIQTAKAAVNKALGQKGYKIVRNDGGNLILVDKEGKPAYSDSHEAVELHNFFDGALAQNKLLVVNDSSGDDSSKQQPAPPIGGGGGIIKGNDSIVAAIDAQLQGLK